MRLHILMAVKVHVMLCSDMVGYQYSGGLCCLHWVKMEAA